SGAAVGANGPAEAVRGGNNGQRGVCRLKGPDNTVPRRGGPKAAPTAATASFLLLPKEPSQRRRSLFGNGQGVLGRTNKPPAHGRFPQAVMSGYAALPDPCRSRMTLSRYRLSHALRRLPRTIST